MHSRYSLLALPAAVLLSLGTAATASAAEGAVDTKSYQTTLEILNDSDATGTAWFTLKDRSLTVKIDAKGLVPNAPHAQHIHGMPTGELDFSCPDTKADDADKDGILNTVEGMPKYGAINISLTTRGDTSEKSGLAVDRFPVADAEGNLSYERTFTVSDKVAENLVNLHVVQHGIDVNGNGEYDFDAGKSELDPKLPQEATAPANCGQIVGSTMGAVPAGGVETGEGSTAGVESAGMIAAGGIALVGAMGAGMIARRRRGVES